MVLGDGTYPAEYGWQMAGELLEQHVDMVV